MVPTHCHIERQKDKLKVRFTFQPSTGDSLMDDVIADNENGQIKMVTAKGKEFKTGPLFDQLYVWYDYIVKR